MTEKRPFPAQVYNVISLTGVGVALFGLAAIVILWILNFFAEGSNPYIGIFTFLVFPGVLFAGLILIPLGMWRERRRLARGQDRPLVVDLSRPHHRNALVVFISGTSFFLLITTIGLYEGYHFTESVEFCGEVCHRVMAPEHTAYYNSSHAKVDCVKCHIGPGADWYVRSKMSGARQVFKTALGTYPRPIPTPIVNLRPAQEVCEQCHWPAKFFPATQMTRDYFLGDRENTHWRVNLLIKVGGTEHASPEGHASGIHWHVADANRMHYIETDETRTEFEYVSWTKGGDEIVYTRGGRAYPDSLIQSARKSGRFRTMDCIDCHNRPAHKYESPMKAVNAALLSGRLDRGIPWIKREAVRALSTVYWTQEGARDSIEASLRAFYDGEGIPLPDGAAAAVQEIYAQNMFPEMRVRWDQYPDHRSHFFFKGCFRCHGSDLATAEGERISADCKLCHTVVAQGPAEALGDTLVYSGLEFKHPVDVGGGERELLCSECHLGDDSIYPPRPRAAALRAGLDETVRP